MGAQIRERKCKFAEKKERSLNYHLFSFAHVVEVISLHAGEAVRHRVSLSPSVLLNNQILPSLSRRSGHPVDICFFAVFATGGQGCRRSACAVAQSDHAEFMMLVNFCHRCSVLSSGTRKLQCVSALPDKVFATPASRERLLGTAEPTTSPSRL